MPDKPKRCKDCAAAGVATLRPAPHPGPRCATHHREAKRAARDRAHETRIARVYGLTGAGYRRLLEIQDGRCFICRRARGVTKKLSVDHDHKTGQVRGLVCRNCNVDLLGHARDDVNVFLRAIEYLLNPPARQLDPAVHLVPREENPDAA